MNIHELATYNLSDAIKFHNRLNPRLWDQDEQLKPEVREKLLEIAADFQEFLGVSDLEVKDITISGSNAAYSYTPHSDIDLHLVVQQPQQNDEVYQELFNAKKYQYNDMHNIRVKGADVELYVQPADQPHVSLGVYSVLNNQWVDVPRRKRAKIDHDIVRHKYDDIRSRIESALGAQDHVRIAALIDKIKHMRQSGLDAHGEFGPENLAFKMLRTQGLIKQLYDAKAAARDQELSLRERERQQQPQQAVTYGFKEDVGSTPDGVSPSTKMFLNETQDVESIVMEFIQDVADRLHINSMPAIKLHTDPEWSTGNKSFGRYEPESHVLHVSLPNRHILDVLRTTAHELCHCKQNELSALPDEAGDTGSDWENEAHAVAGIFMRNFANQHPEYFSAQSELDEGIGQRIAGAALAGLLSLGTGAQAQTVGQVLGGATGVARAVQSLKNMGWAGTQEELTQEIKNYSRALGGDPQAQNQSVLYRKQHQTTQDTNVPASADKANTDFEAYKQDYYRKKAEFDKRFQQNENASGYIPTRAQAKDPRYSTALTVDIRPGQVGKEANKMGLKTDRQGRPALIMKSANLRESQLAERLRDELAALSKTQELNKVRTNRTGDRLDSLGNQLPVGAETKPTMPKGTVRVDVSDVYDWYKLGQHISNLDGLGQHDFGKGPPSSIVSFGDEETEHKFIDNLKKTGLDVTDIDPVDPKQPKGMKPIKTDPTFNVAESDDQSLTELLDPKTAFPLKWDKQFAGQGEFHAWAQDADGREIGISFTPVADSDATEVVFTRGGTHDMTGKGDAARVMATVIKAINIFVDQYKPPYLVFTAKTGGGRASAYTAMIRRAASGYELLSPEQYPEELSSYLRYIGSDQAFVLARS